MKVLKVLAKSPGKLMAVDKNQIAKADNITQCLPISVRYHFTSTGVADLLFQDLVITVFSAVQLQSTSTIH